MSDGACEDSTGSVQMEEIKRAILALPFVTKLSPVRAHKSHGAGWGATLKCASCPSCCGKRQEAPVQVSSVHPTELACLQELLKRLQDRHVDCAEAVAKKAAADAASAATVDPDAPNVLQAIMKLEQANARAKTANKVALEAEKEKDAAEKAVEELKRQLTVRRQRACKTVAMYNSGLARIKRSLAQARTASCITRVLVWLGGFHIGPWGTLI